MKKRIVSTILSFCMLLSLFPMTSAWAADDTTELQKKLDNGGTVTLSKDCEITTTLTINKTVTLDLNGYVLKMTGEGSVIMLKNSGAGLTIADSTPNRTHGDSSFPAGGVITGGTGSTQGNTSVIRCGGGVYIGDSCTAEMTGGTIYACSAYYGGGVYLKYESKFIMSGGSISDCHAGGRTASYNAGDGIYMGRYCTFKLKGGSVNSGIVNLDGSMEASGGVINDNVIIVWESGILPLSCAATAESYPEFRGDVIVEGTLKNITLDNVSGGVFCRGIKNFEISQTNGTQHAYTVSFDFNGGNGTALPTQWFLNASGAKAVKPEIAPTRSGYAFVGWYNGDKEYTFTETVTQSITLKAKWESIGVSSENELKNKLAMGLELVKLEKDLSLSSTLDISDKTLTIDLNGHVLTGNINIADTSSSNASELTLIDSTPSATHSDTSLPSGGVLKGNITLSRGNGGSKSVLNANGGNVTGNLNLHSYAAKVYNTCDNKTTTSFYGKANASIPNAEVYGGIYYGGIDENFKTCVKGILLTFYVDDAEYCYEVYTEINPDHRMHNTIAPVDPVKEGYSFSSWKYTNIGSSVDWRFGTNYYIFPRKLDAAFTADTYTISYDLNGGDPGDKTNPSTYTAESNSITLNNPTKNGYDFTGWSGTGLTGENNTNVIIYKGSIGNREYTAHYSPKSGYSVIFDSNGGSTVDGKTDVKWTDKVLSGASEPTKKGYTFKGWKCVSIDVDENTTYADLATDDKTTSVTLTAQWEVKSGYSVTFDSNGGSTVDGKTDVKWTDKVLSGASEPTKKGYTFKGWKCVSIDVDENTTYADLATDDKTTSVTLTAQWEVKSGYSVTFDSNGGSTVNGKTDVKWTDKVLDGVSEPTRPGYIFNGWKCGTVKVSSNITYASLAKNDNVLNVDLTAQWKQGPANTLRFNGNGGLRNGSATYSVYTNADHYTISNDTNNGFIRTDYVFVGWNTEPDGKGKNIVKDDRISFGLAHNGEIVVLYAQWLDAISPVISGVEDGKTYCEAREVTVSDNIGIASVTVNGNSVTPENGKFTLSPADGTQNITVTDTDGNVTEVTVTVNNGHTGGTATCINKAVCEICDAEYGDIDANKHTMLKHVEAVEATTESEGNIEYWYCEDCGKYFGDANGENEIDLADTVVGKLPEVIPPQTADSSLIPLSLISALISGIAAVYVYAKKKCGR